MYTYDFKHRPAKEMTHVDALSRLPINEKTGIKSFKLETNSIPVNIKIVKQHLDNDVFLSQFLLFIKLGFPKDLKSMLNDKKFMYYYKLRNDFYSDDNLLYYRDRIVVPDSLHEEILKMLHNEHDGIVRMKMKCRMYFWWKNVDESIE
jgi:hypothetical protein